MLRYYLENPGEKIDVEGFFSEELRDWVACERAKRALENRRRGDDEPEVAEALRVATEAKDFRPELPALFDLLALDSLDSTEDGEQSGDAADGEWERIRAARRRKALLEASALGVDLLSENETVASIVGGLKGAPKKNRDVLAELRNLQKNIEGKESLS